MKKIKYIFTLFAVSMMLTACKKEAEIPLALENEVTEVPPVLENKAAPQYQYDYTSVELDLPQVSAGFRRVDITSDEYPILKQAVDEYFDKYIEERTQIIMDMSDEIEANASNENITYYINSNSVDVKCADSNIFSFVISTALYTRFYDENGDNLNHIYFEYTGVNFDANTGEIIEFEDLGDILADVSSNLPEIHDFVDRELVANVDDLLQAKMDRVDSDVPFYIDGRGLNLLFYQNECLTEPDDQLFQLPIIINTTYDEMPGFNPEYIPTSSDYRVTITNSLCDNLVDINGDGVKDSVGFSYDLDEYEWPINAMIHIDGKSFSADEVADGYSAEGYNAYYYNVDNRNYIYVDRCYSNDWAEAALYEIVNEDLELALYNSGSIESFTKDGLIIGTRCNLLGTWGVSKKFTFDDSGKLGDAEGLYYTSRAYDPDYLEEDDYIWSSITTVQEITDKNGTTIPAQTRLFPVCTDGKLYIMFQDSDHNKYEFDLEETNEYWGYYINGIRDDELFEYLPYAG